MVSWATSSRDVHHTQSTVLPVLWLDNGRGEWEGAEMIQVQNVTQDIAAPSGAVLNKWGVLSVEVLCTHLLFSQCSLLWLLIFFLFLGCLGALLVTWHLSVHATKPEWRQSPTQSSPKTETWAASFRHSPMASVAVLFIAEDRHQAPLGICEGA